MEPNFSLKKLIQGYNCRVYEKAYEELLLMKNMEA